MLSSILFIGEKSLTYKKNTTSCLLCHSEITVCNLTKHYNSKACQNGSTSRIPKLTCCPHCLEDASEFENFASHVRWCEKDLSIRRKAKFKICPTCDLTFEVSPTQYRKKFCSDACRVHTSETKLKMSMGRSKYLNDNKDLHPWKRKDKQISVPCENVKKYLTENDYEFLEEYSPIPDRQFSIDIVFPHLMIGLEINGNHHYDNTGKLKPYYQERHDLIESYGWKLFEIHYSKCFSDYNIANFLEFDYAKSNDGIEQYIQAKKPKHIPMAKGQKIRTESDAKYNAMKDEVFNQGIDFTKFGWGVKLSAFLNLPNSGRWMKRYHPEFYASNCFIKNTTLLH